MEIPPEKVFKHLSKELIKERKKQSFYYAHLYKAALFEVPGSTTEEERLKSGVRQISDVTLKYAGYTLAAAIKANSPLKHLHSLYDLLAAVGKAFFLNVKIANNGKPLQEISYEADEGFGRPLRDFAIDLKDRVAIRSYSFGPVSTITPVDQNSSNSKFLEMNRPDMLSVRAKVMEDELFGETLAKHSLKPKKIKKITSVNKSTFVEGTSEKDGKKTKSQKSTSPSFYPKPEKSKKLAEDMLISSSSSSSDTGSSIEQTYRPEQLSASSESSDDEVPPLKKAKVLSTSKDSVKVSTPPIKIVKQGHDVDYKVVPSSSSEPDREFAEQRRLLSDILEKHVQWCQKLDKHLLSHVTDCEFCPIHCLGPQQKDNRSLRVLNVCLKGFTLQTMFPCTRTLRVRCVM